jgi:hypothetical protein
MNLYVQQYDFTPARLFGFWFFALAAILLVILAVHVITKTRQYKYLQQALVVCGVAMLVFTMSTPDALSVKMNIARADDGQIAAFPLFNQLSAEAYPIMEEVLLNEDYGIGLVTDPTEFCPYVVGGYDHAGNRTGVRATDLSENLYIRDTGLRIDLKIFQDNLFNHYYTDKDGDGEKESRTGWRAWNYSRENIPRLRDGEPAQDFLQEAITEDQIVVACDIPFRENTNPSTAPVDSE